MVIGYMKYSNYIITIETLNDFKIPENHEIGTSIRIDDYKIISIEDVTGKFYDYYYETGFEIKKKIKLSKEILYVLIPSF